MKHASFRVFTILFCSYKRYFILVSLLKNKKHFLFSFQVLSLLTRLHLPYGSYKILSFSLSSSLCACIIQIGDEINIIRITLLTLNYYYYYKYVCTRDKTINVFFSSAHEISSPVTHIVNLQSEVVENL